MAPRDAQNGAKKPHGRQDPDRIAERGTASPDHDLPDFAQPLSRNLLQLIPGQNPGFDLAGNGSVVAATAPQQQQTVDTCPYGSSQNRTTEGVEQNADNDPVVTLGHRCTYRLHRGPRCYRNGSCNQPRLGVRPVSKYQILLHGGELSIFCPGSRFPQ